MSIPAIHVGSLTLGPFPIHWYALAYIAGIGLGYRYCRGLVTNARLWGGRPPTATPPQIYDLLLWVTIGIIGVALAVILFGRRKGIDLLLLADMVAPCEPVGHFFVRIANFVNGELWGRVTHVPWGIVFCNAHIAAANNGVCPAGTEPRHPSQLYEAGLEGLVMFLVLRWATHRAKWLQRRGAIFGLGLICYGLFRTSLEWVRNPDEGMLNFPLGLTMGMIPSIPMFIAGAMLLCWGLRMPGPKPQVL